MARPILSEFGSLADMTDLRAHVRKEPEADIRTSTSRSQISLRPWEDLGKQRRGAVHVARFAIGHGLGFGIQQLTIDKFSQHQHVVASGYSCRTSHSNQANASRSKGRPWWSVFHSVRENLSAPAGRP
jgi:hypothetical protein